MSVLSTTDKSGPNRIIVFGDTVTARMEEPTTREAYMTTADSKGKLCQPLQKEPPVVSTGFLVVLVLPTNDRKEHTHRYKVVTCNHGKVLDKN